MGFGGGSSKPMAGEQLQEKQKADAAAEAEKSSKRERQDTAAIRARRRRGAGRTLLSPSREEAQTGLSSKLGGGS